jgi:hypothetical protein
VARGRQRETMTQDRAPAPVPRWLAFVLKSDRAGSSWYIGTGFFFAPVLAVLAPWPEVRTLLWVLIALAGLWLGLLGIAMATGLALILRAGGEISEDYWRSMLDYRSTVYHHEGRCP